MTSSSESTTFFSFLFFLAKIQILGTCRTHRFRSIVLKVANGVRDDAFGEIDGMLLVRSTREYERSRSMTFP